jgi:hypothetical protein
MKLTDRRIIMGVGWAIVALGALGFALGVQQGQRPPAEPQPLPLPVNTGHPINIEGVPRAAALDPSAPNGAIDPAAARARARKSQVDADNAMDDGPDETPAAPPTAPTAGEPQDLARPGPRTATPPAAGNSLHGPFR